MGPRKGIRHIFLAVVYTVDLLELLKLLLPLVLFDTLVPDSQQLEHFALLQEEVSEHSLGFLVIPP